LVMRIKPSRIEYVEHNLNFANFCPHNCQYCYMTPLRGKREPTIDFDFPELRRQLERFEPKGDILLSSSHDPMASKELREVCFTILSIISKEAPSIMPKIRFLSKAGEFPALFIPWNLKFGQTITTLREDIRLLVEPGASSVQDRIKALKKAKEHGKFTWISFEPCFKGTNIPRVLELIEPDEAWVGKLNHEKAIWMPQFIPPLALSPQGIWKQIKEAREMGFNVEVKQELAFHRYCVTLEEYLGVGGRC